MDRVHRIAQAIQATSVAAGVVAAQQATVWATNHAFPGAVPSIAALVAFAVAAQGLRWGLEFALESSRWIRRLLTGSQFVEGVWLDLMSQDNVPIAIGRSVISFAGSSVRYGGEDFSLDGKQRGLYTIDLMQFTWPIMRYKYTYNTTTRRDEGWGEAAFMERAGPPTFCSGCFVSLLDGARLTFESWRITDTQLLSSLDRDQTRRSAIQTFFAPILAERDRK
jgi:hypothetical protein